MVIAQRPSRNRPSVAARRVGYLVAIAVNAALLYVVNNILDWDLLPFLTEDFDRVVPIVNVSLVATIVANLGYVAFDAPWFKSAGETVLLAISLAVTLRLYRVFPFDFSAYEFDWEIVCRGVLILAMVGIGIAIVVETIKLIGAWGGRRRAYV